MSDNNKSLLNKIFGDVVGKPKFTTNNTTQYGGATSYEPAPVAAAVETSASETMLATTHSPAPTELAATHSTHTPSSPKPNMFVQFGGKKKTGGAIKELTDGSPLFKRMMILIFIFFCAFYFASVTFQSEKVLTGVLKLRGQDEDDDFNFDDPNVNFMQRWRKIIQIIVVFIFLAIAYVLAIFLTVYLGILVYVGVEGKHDKVAERAKEIMSEWFMIFDLDGTTFNMKTFYYIILGLVFVLMLFYMLYFIFVKGYLPKLYYQTDVNTDKTDAPELYNATKFALYYGIYVIMAVLYVFILMTLFYLSGNTLMFSCTIYVVIFMMFTLLIYKYTMERNKKNVFIIFLVFFIYVILHMLFLT